MSKGEDEDEDEEEEEGKQRACARKEEKKRAVAGGELAIAFVINYHSLLPSPGGNPVIGSPERASVGGAAAIWFNQQPPDAGTTRLARLSMLKNTRYGHADSAQGDHLAIVTAAALIVARHRLELILLDSELPSIMRDFRGLE